MASLPVAMMLSCHKNHFDLDHSGKPNIIFIYADDLGYGDLGSYGQKDILTPNLDKMAEEGMRFTRAYAGHTVCAPSRSALMTGYHTGKTPVRGNRSVDGPRIPLSDTTTTIAHILGKAGYINGIFGKWGLGEAGSTGIPTRQGFHEFYGFLNQRRAHSYCEDYLWHNENLVFLEGNSGNRCHNNTAEWIFQQLKEFVRKNKNRPFFAYYATQLPHAEMRSTDQDIRFYLDEDGKSIFDEELYDKERLRTDVPYRRLMEFIERDHRRGGRTGQPLANYAAMVTQLDRHVGELVLLLEELELSDNTLIIFTSDNGPAREGGYRPEYFNSSGNLRGIKRDLYEGGIRVPMIAQWPGTIPPGVVSDYQWAAWDLMPTVAEMSGVSIPEGIDGVSALPVFRGEVIDRPNVLYWECTLENRREEGDISVAVIKGRWKAIANDGITKGLELYDLDQDPGETRNLASKYPEKVASFWNIIKETRTPSEHWPVSDEIWKTAIQ